MPDKSIPLKGFTSEKALWHICRYNGYNENFTIFRDTCSIDTTPESIIFSLQQKGIQARMASIEIDDLMFLKLPTCIQLIDGKWLIIRKIDKKKLEIEFSDGIQICKPSEIVKYMTGQVIDISDPIPRSASLFSSFIKLIITQKSNIVQIIFATLMSQLLLLALPEITAVAMNRALPDGASETLTLVAIGVFLIALFQAWTGWTRDRIVLYITTRLEISVEQGFLSHLLQLPFPLLQQRTLGDMLQAFSGLVTAREHLVEKGIGALLDGIMAIIFLIVMAFKLPLPTLLVVIVAGIMSLLAIVIGKNQANIQVHEVEAQARQQGFLTELISGCGTIKAAGAENKGVNKWMFLFRGELQLELKKNRLGLWSETGLPALQQGLLAAILIWGGRLCLDGKIQIGTLFAFLQLSSGFLSAIFGVISAYLIVCILKPQLSKANDILKTEPQRHHLRITNESHMLRKPVIMEDVWFRYSQDSPWVLKGYSLRIDPGDKFTLKDKTGMGKSTILRLLAGLYTPDKGVISIGGIPPKAAQRKILYLPQFTNLYGGTIIENLRILSGGVSVQHLIEVSGLTGLDKYITTLPMDYNTILPPGGRSLSGGQRQLIILTAALASGRAFVLLDEATASIDNVLSGHLKALINNAPWTAVMATHAV